jgi:hypothetical protein
MTSEDNKEIDIERLEKALHFSNTMQTFNLAKNNLKVKTQNLLSYSEYGGTFNITQEFIGFLNAVKSADRKNVVILDKNETPIKIEDVSEFLNNVLSVYFEVVNEYNNEYQKLKSSRKIEKFLDITK